jgi:hypothetical protein
MSEEADYFDRSMMPCDGCHRLPYQGIMDGAAADLELNARVGDLLLCPSCRKENEFMDAIAKLTLEAVSFGSSQYRLRWAALEYNYAELLSPSERRALGRIVRHRHKDGQLCRHIFLAMAFLRGKPYRDVEWKCDPTSPPGEVQIWKILADAKAFKPQQEDEIVAQLVAWRRAPPDMALNTKKLLEFCTVLARQAGILVKPQKATLTKSGGVYTATAGTVTATELDPITALMQVHTILSGYVKQKRADLAEAHREAGENLRAKRLRGNLRVALVEAPLAPISVTEEDCDITEVDIELKFRANAQETP